MSGRGDTGCTCSNKQCPHYCPPQNCDETEEEEHEEEEDSCCGGCRPCFFILAAIIGAASGLWWCYCGQDMDANLALCSMGSTISIGQTKLTGPKLRINDPSVIISGKQVIPGDALCYESEKGEFYIRLPAPAIITGITYEHISSNEHPDRNIHSAPKKFIISGIQRDVSKTPSETFLGKFKYMDNGYPAQSLKFKKEDKVFSEVKIDIISNHGNNFTCVYRIKIHGKTERLK